MKISKSTSTLILLILLSSSIIIIIQTGQQKIVYRNDYSIEDFVNIDNNAIKGEIKANEDLIIFFNNPTDYHNFIEKYNQYHILREYPNLLAIKLQYSTQLIETIPSFSIDGIYPSSYFELQYHIPLPELRSNVQLDSFASYDVGQLLNISGLWDLGFNGTDTSIAIIDNGIEFNHPQLLGKEQATFDISSNDTSACKTHGTAVAGAAAADYDINSEVIGTGFGSMLVDIQLGCQGNSITGDFLAGFDYVLANNATIDVLNTSFGGFAPSWDFIVEKLESVGIVTVGSAGNSGPNKHTTSTGGPGNSLHAISVGMVDSSDNLALVSSRGPAHSMLYKPDILAWGVGVNLTNSDLGYSTISGTSFSSPFIAGSVATLISALEAQSIQWNPGLIKAALLQTADVISGNELDVGQGIANIGNAYQSIISAERDVSELPYAIAMTPKDGPMHYIETVPYGMQLNIPLTLVTSHPDNISITFSGDLAGVSSYNPLGTTYSQKLDVVVNTTKLTPNTSVNGAIIAQVGNETVTSTIQLQVGDVAKGSIGVDLYHTYWDQIGANSIGGSNIGETLKLAMEMGYIVKEIHSELNSTMLQEYDVLWIPDPANILNFDFEFSEANFTSAEIQAIIDFVKSGKSLFIDFFGLLEDVYGGDPPESYFGNDPVVINQIIEDFGITALETPLPTSTDIGASTFVLKNGSSIVGAAIKQTHAGNYLSVNNTWQAISTDGTGRISTATFTDYDTGGRVVVTSTNFWIDNYAILGGYGRNGGAGLDNKILTQNTINWLNQNTRMGKLADQVTDDWIYGEFFVLTDGLPELQVPASYVIKDGNRTDITLTNMGMGKYSFNFSIAEQATHQVVVELNGEYLAWNKIYDVSGPNIIPYSSNLNGTVFEAKLQSLKFDIIDDTTSVDDNSVLVSINDTSYPSSLYDFEAGELTVFLDMDELDIDRYSTYFIMTISAKDTRGNLAKIDYHFEIINADYEPPDASDNDTTLSNGKSSETEPNKLIQFLQGDLAQPIGILVGLAVFALVIENIRLRRRN